MCGFFTPVNLSSRTYDIGFPLNVPKNSATFLQQNSDFHGTSQNYFLFSPWFVNSMSSINGTYVFGSSSDAYSTRLLSSLSKANEFPIKTWYDHVIYKQEADEERTPGKPNVLFAEKNSVITYAMQHKALFTQRCLYVIKFKEVKAGDYIGLKREANTGEGFDTLIWWSVDGSGKVPGNVTSREFREIKATKSTTVEELADMIASSINDKGTTIFHIPNITDDKYDYYIRY
uniref:Uncharacterized protein n=1 Tax=Wolbachia endosymbiont of Aleurodicus floccissimus TaxID=2152762 RepID=A0A3B0IXB9_9RICK